MHPPFRSLTFMPFFSRTSLSTPMAPKSFSMTTTFRPLAIMGSSILRMTDVLPTPSRPATMIRRMPGYRLEPI